MTNCYSSGYISSTVYDTHFTCFCKLQFFIFSSKQEIVGKGANKYRIPVVLYANGHNRHKTTNLIANGTLSVSVPNSNVIDC